MVLVLVLAGAVVGGGKSSGSCAGVCIFLSSSLRG